MALRIENHCDWFVEIVQTYHKFFVVKDESAFWITLLGVNETKSKTPQFSMKMCARGLISFEQQLKCYMAIGKIEQCKCTG